MAERLYYHQNDEYSNESNVDVLFPLKMAVVLLSLNYQDTEYCLQHYLITNTKCFDIAIKLRIDKYEDKFSIDYYEDRLGIDKYEELKNKPYHS